MEQSTYKRQLAHPKWQKLRLKIFERDNFTCQKCSSTENELHVHHIYYLPKMKPYDYPEKSLATLCHSCHESEEAKLSLLSQTILPRLRKLGATARGIENLLDSLELIKPYTSVHNVGVLLSDISKLSKKDRKDIYDLMEKLATNG